MKYLPIIMSHGRPERVLTYDSLRKQGYAGPICVLIDNEDKKADGYREKFGADVQVFDKTKWANKTDVCDNYQHRRAIVYARNACYEIARKLGYRWFIQLDDDYTDWQYNFDECLRWNRKPIKSLHELFAATFEFLEDSKVAAIAWAQGGDFFGGGKCTHIWPAIQAKRKCMNTWFCDTERPLSYAGHMNEDCSCYVVNGVRGGAFLQLALLQIMQTPTQAAAGGMSELYESSGTYLKSLYTLIQAPSCTRIHAMNSLHGRLHHWIEYNHCAPKIIPERFRKAA